MAIKATSLRWGVEQRLEFIEFRLFWEGSINRSDIIDTFGVSVPQASKDLSLYQEHAPGNMEYDPREKCYVAQSKFTLRYLEPDPYVYLSRLRLVSEVLSSPQESWIGMLPEADVAITPRRDIDIVVLRTLLKAIRDKRSIDIHYQSMSPNRPDPIWRKITPHAFGYDGFRWHTRAYCHLQDKFKDFLLPRILEVGEFGLPGELSEMDHLWFDFFDIEIAAHPGLTESQKIVVGKDYGFVGGKGLVSVRYAMLFYVLKRLGLLGHPEKEDPRRQHIVALRPRDVQNALAKASSQQMTEISAQNLI
ncbi:MAG: WYL domain-containing protein [Paracoccaceae bacterium]